MSRLWLLVGMAFAFTASQAAAQGLENELVGKRDIDVPQYKSEQGAILVDEKGTETEYSIDYGIYKKNYVILLLRDTGAKTNTDSRVNEIVQVVRAAKPKGLDFYSAGCYLRPGPDPQPGEYVFAYAGNFRNDGVPGAIKGAWMFDWQAKKLVTVPEGKVDCREPGD